MRVEQDDRPLMEHSARAFDRAGDDTLHAAQANAAVITGEYRQSLRRTRVAGDEKLSLTIGSPLPQAGAVEHGANVGPRRGPHMEGNLAIGRAVDDYPAAMTRRLREP